MRMGYRHNSANNQGILLLAALAAAVALAAPALLAPAPAWAADYQCDQVDLTAQVETDGTVTVTDQRIFDFAADETKSETLTWLYQGFPSPSSTCAWPPSTGRAT